MLTTLRGTLPALLILLALATACSDSASVPDTGVVRGEVSRLYSDEAIAGASVRVGEETAVTDAEGRFRFTRVPQGEVVLRVSAAGFQDLARTIEVGEYQSLSLELTPVDTLVSITGLVTHRVDGPQRVQIDHDLGSLITDGDGGWSLDEVPIGPLSLVIEQAPYNRFATELLVHTDGQHFVQTLSRDITVSWWVEDDSYVFTRDDSLNANRGDRTQLLVTEELGRTAVFSLTVPEPGYPWAELVGAELALHGFRGLTDGEDAGEARPLEVRLMGLDGPFFEGSIDFAVRPGFHQQNLVTVTLAEEPLEQPVVIDILGAIQGTPASFWSLGIGLATSAEQATIFLLSSEYGRDEPAILARPRATYRLRI